MKFISWNVNGVRACLDKGLRNYVTGCDPDVICFQEVKAEQHQADFSWLKDYQVIWNPAVKKGYSGTAIFSRLPVKSQVLGLGMTEHDCEGRVIAAEFPDFFLVNVYTPNSQNELVRLPYRMRWDVDFLAYLQRLEKQKPVIVCGDLNVAHKEIDIARPRENRFNPGFSDQERSGFDRLVEAGFVDTFREFDKRPHQYSWWSYRANARANNVGWRIDYWLASQALRPKITASRIRPEIHGSDHCPVEMEMD